MSTDLRLAVVNVSTLVPAADVERVVAACRTQLATHLQPAWAAGAVVEIWPDLACVPDGAFPVLVADDEQQVGALGHHDVTQAMIGVRDAQLMGVPWSCVLSHELCETVVNPQLARWSAPSSSSGVVWAVEVCDPVENQRYEIGGVAVSDFVYPAFFEAGSQEKVLNWRKTLAGAVHRGAAERACGGARGRWDGAGAAGDADAGVAEVAAITAAAAAGEGAVVPNPCHAPAVVLYSPRDRPHQRPLDARSREARDARRRRQAGPARPAVPSAVRDLRAGQVGRGQDEPDAVRDGQARRQAAGDHAAHGGEADDGAGRVAPARLGEEGRGSGCLRLPNAQGAARQRPPGQGHSRTRCG